MNAELSLRRHGAQLFKGAVADSLNGLRASLAHLPKDQPGVRLRASDDLKLFLTANGAIGSIAAAVQGVTTRPVRAIFFDKTPQVNWSLGWHQDRTICVKQRLAVNGFGPWTVKGGMQHVAPPFGLLARMITLRVHLDDVPDNNAPLLIAPGSHAEGLVPVAAIKDVVQRCGTYACLANAGDIWLYATPILHASDATNAGRRRVLQIDFANDELPGGLEWLGV